MMVRPRVIIGKRKGKKARLKYPAMTSGYISREPIIHTARGKLAPIPSAMWSLLSGRNYIGEEYPDIYTDDLPEAVRNEIMPMAIQDIWSAWQEDGLAGGIVASSAIFGANSASYPDPLYDEWADKMSTTIGRNLTTQELIAIRPDFNDARANWMEYEELAEKSKYRYRKDNPEIEASMYFWGRLTILSTPEARDAFNKMIDDYDLPEEAFPIREEIEPFDASGKDQDETMNELIDRLPSELADYVWENQDTLITQDLVGMIETIEKIKTADRVLLDKYDRDMKGEDVTTKANYRRENPEIDAALNFWRNISTTKSGDASKLLSQKYESLGLPAPEGKGTLKLKKTGGINRLLEGNRLLTPQTKEISRLLK